VRVNLQATKFVYVMAYPISGFPLHPPSSKRARVNLSHGTEAAAGPDTPQRGSLPTGRPWIICRLDSAGQRSVCGVRASAMKCLFTI
jgi:hypothetical protein